MELKIDLLHEKDYDVLTKQDMRSNVLIGLNEGGFMEIVSGHTSLDCIVVRRALSKEERKEVNLNKLTIQRNKLNRKIATLKKANLKPQQAPAGGEKEFKEWLAN